jgi:hypothetical protein
MCVFTPFLLSPPLTQLSTGKLDVDDPGNDDFELWSPSEERSERCLFGRQVKRYPHC